MDAEGLVGATQRRDELSKQGQSQQRQVLKTKGQSGLAAIEFDRNTGVWVGRMGNKAKEAATQRTQTPTSIVRLTGAFGCMRDPIPIPVVAPKLA